jgi:hypothetical protein
MTDRKETESHSRRRHLDSRTAVACDGRPDHDGLGFRRANTFWKARVVYFHMHHFGAKTFSANGAVTPYFGPLRRVSC